jgi:TolB-like protein/Tfp pilus assembly protein PilF
MGDGILASFGTITDAIYCAGFIQRACENETHLNLRIGIHQGEIVNQGADVFGSGVNIASRIQAIAPIGGIWVSDSVQRNIQNKKGIEIKFVKEETLKNVKQPVRIYNVKVVCEELQQDSKAYVSAKPEPSLKNQNSIAVLPFVNMSSDTEQEFFCEGISEEIINTIVQLPDLKVAGRTSCFSFKGKNEDLRLIGKQLGVHNILEGSVRKFGKRVRITAQLIEVSTGFHLWSNKYDRDLVDVFEIQDEIALEIAKQLQATLLGKKVVPKTREQTQSVEAYQLYCKGRSLYYQRGVSLYEALRCFQSALAIDPNYALASSGLADTYIMLSFHGYLSPTECWKKAIPASQNALKYGPDLAETHNTLAVIQLLHDRNLEAAERDFKKALTLNPLNIQARVWYSLFLLTYDLERYEDGIEQSKIAIDNDPLSSYAFSCYALVLAAANKTNESIDAAKDAGGLEPKAMLPRYTLSYCYLCAGEYEKALEECEIAVDSSNRHAWNLNLIMAIFMEMGRKEEALKIYRELEIRYTDHNAPPSNLAIGAAIVGKDKYALELAHIALDTFDPYMSCKGAKDRCSQALRNIEGFDQIFERLGFPGLPKKT